MAQDLTFRIKKEDALLRKMFADAVIENGFLELVKKDPTLFHETLELALSRNWLKPSQLAKALNTSESNTRKWFKTMAEERSTPNVPTRVAVFQAASALIKEDVNSIEEELASSSLKYALADEPAVAQMARAVVA